MREQHQDERGERDEADQDVCERRGEENELGRDGGDENESVQGCAHLVTVDVAFLSLMYGGVIMQHGTESKHRRIIVRN